MKRNNFRFLVVGTNFISENFADAVDKVDRACAVCGECGSGVTGGVSAGNETASGESLEAAPSGGIAEAAPSRESLEAAPSGDLFPIDMSRFCGDGYFPGAPGFGGCGISAVLSRKKETGEAFSSRCAAGAVTVCTLEEAARFYEAGGFDAAYIASPNALHEVQSVYFLERGIPVLCEKPAAVSLSSFERIADAAVRGGAFFAEAMRPAHDPAIDAICRAVELIAPVRMARLEFSQYSSRYARFLAGEPVNTFNPAMGNAALLDLGVYAISCALMLFGEPEAISPRSVFLENGFEAAGSAAFAYPGFLCNINYSKVCEGASPSVILGEGGAVTVDRLSEPREVKLRLGKNGEFHSVITGAPENNMIYEIADFIRICTGGTDGGAGARTSGTGVHMTADDAHISGAGKNTTADGAHTSGAGIAPAASSVRTVNAPSALFAAAGKYPCTDGAALLELSRAQCRIIEKICSETGIKFCEAK